MKFASCLSTLPWITGRLSSLIQTAKAFFPISYYRLSWQTVVVNRKKGLNLAEKRG